MWYDTLKEKRMWDIFEQISRIPRESGNEGPIREFLLKWAEEHGLRADRDEIGNVFIYSPATPGYEKVKPIALQGHMDMVCVRTDDSKHDFTKDPIEVYLDDEGFIRAKDTSLGADNGIMIAMTLALFTDPEAKHGPLEAVITISEETGLTGAFNLDPAKIESKRMINLDSEEEDIIYIGCAGGVDFTATLPVAREENIFPHTYKVEVSGLLGGHSGGEIHKERGNAFKVLARCLRSLSAYRVAEIAGGSKRNVIPSYAYAVIAAKNDPTKKIAKIEKMIRNELKFSDPGLAVRVTEIEKVPTVIRKKQGEKLVDAIIAAPHGVAHMSSALPGVVETSNNMAIIETKEDAVTVINSIRSNIGSARDAQLEVLNTVYKAFGFKVEHGDGYPEWEPDPDSKFTKTVAAAYERIMGKKPVITAIHAGLECGIINKRVKGMDSLSLGPNLFDVHSVNEHIDAASAERIYGFMTELLGSIR